MYIAKIANFQANFLRRLKEIRGIFVEFFKEIPLSSIWRHCGFFLMATMQTKKTFVFALEPMENCRGHGTVKNTAEYPVHVFSSPTSCSSPPFYGLSSVNPRCLLTTTRWMGIVFNAKTGNSVPEKPSCDTRIIPALIFLASWNKMNVWRRSCYCVDNDQSCLFISLFISIPDNFDSA